MICALPGGWAAIGEGRRRGAQGSDLDPRYRSARRGDRVGQQTIMMSSRTTLASAVLVAAVALGAQTPDDASPLESGDLRGISMISPSGTRIEYFRLDLDDAGAEEDGPVGVARWISGPDGIDGATAGRRLELEVLFFDVDTRVIHTEHLRPEERKLVYREVRERGGRTVLLEWSPEDGPRSTEVVNGVARRREIGTDQGVLLPLYLVEHARAGVPIEGPFAVFSPLAGDAEVLDIEMRKGAGAASALGAHHELTLHRPGRLQAGRYVFEGERLVRFQWQEGGPVARPISVDDYHGWLRRHRTDRGH